MHRLVNIIYNEKYDLNTGKAAFHHLPGVHGQILRTPHHPFFEFPWKKYPPTIQ
jgi:hypothetical protein